MEKHDNMKSPASPQEWYEAGVSLRARERFGEAVNAFRTAADLASAAISAAESSSFPPCADGRAAGDGVGKGGGNGEGLEELRKIRSASLAFIDLIDEIRSFVNKDLLNP